MHINLPVDKTLSKWLLTIGILALISQIGLVYTLHTLFSLLIITIASCLPIGFFGVLFDSVAAYLNQASSIDSKKHDHKMMVFVSIYFIGNGILLYLFSKYVYNIQMMIGHSLIDGITHSYLIMGAFSASAVYYSLRYFFTKN